jgi:hypothetical protein
VLSTRQRGTFLELCLTDRNPHRKGPGQVSGLSLFWLKAAVDPEGHVWSEHCALIEAEFHASASARSIRHFAAVT